MNTRISSPIPFIHSSIPLGREHPWQARQARQAASIRSVLSIHRSLLVLCFVCRNCLEQRARTLWGGKKGPASPPPPSSSRGCHRSRCECACAEAVHTSTRNWALTRRTSVAVSRLVQRPRSCRQPGQRDSCGHRDCEQRVVFFHCPPENWATCRPASMPSGFLTSPTNWVAPGGRAPATKVPR